jgi:hypothetical protein
MLNSIIKAVLAPKQLVIAVATVAVIFGSLSTIPNATAQISTDGTTIDFSNGITIDVNNGRYTHVQVGGGQGVVVTTDGTVVDLGFLSGLLGGFLP